MLAFFALVFLMLMAAGAILALFAVGAVFVVVLPALRVRIPRPEGVKLSAQNAPLLLDLVERRRRELRASRLSGVLLVEDPTAYVCEVPRLGLLGWNWIYLVLGLPYLLALTPEELEGVVATSWRTRRVVTARGSRRPRQSARRQQLDADLDQREHGPASSSAVPQALCAASSRRRSWSGVGTSTRRTGPPRRRRGRRRDQRPAPDLAARTTSGRGALGRAEETCRSQPHPPVPFTQMRQVVAGVPARSSRLTELLRHVESDRSHPATVNACGRSASRRSSRYAEAARCLRSRRRPRARLQELIAGSTTPGEAGSRMLAERHHETQLLREQLHQLEPGRDIPESSERAALAARSGRSRSGQKAATSSSCTRMTRMRSRLLDRARRLASGDERGLESLARAVELDVHGRPEPAVAAIDFLIDRDRPDEVDTWRCGRGNTRCERRSRAKSVAAAPDGSSRATWPPAEAVDEIREELVGLRRTARPTSFASAAPSSPRKSDSGSSGSYSGDAGSDPGASVTSTS